ncbi:MAG: hypothetical protein ACRC7N_02370 [Clostridium sp.]
MRINNEYFTELTEAEMVNVEGGYVKVVVKTLLELAKKAGSYIGPVIRDGIAYDAVKNLFGKIIDGVKPGGTGITEVRQTKYTSLAKTHCYNMCGYHR